MGNLAFRLVNNSKIVGEWKGHARRQVCHKALHICHSGPALAREESAVPTSAGKISAPLLRGQMPVVNC
jgi:hypothetical protein